jgi:hypothetical protein
LRRPLQCRGRRLVPRRRPPFSHQLIECRQTNLLQTSATVQTSATAKLCYRSKLSRAQISPLRLRSLNPPGLKSASGSP